MRKVLMIGLAAVLGLSQAAYAESQNPHDPSNQPSNTDTDIHADSDVNADPETGASDTATPNPNSLGRTGRLPDSPNIQRNQGAQTAPSDSDNISDRIENANDADRNLYDRLDGRQSPTVDPTPNGDPNSATSNSGVSSDTGANGTAKDRSATSSSDTATHASARPGSRAVSGTGSASGSGTTGSSSGRGSNSGSSSGAGER